MRKTSSTIALLADEYVGYRKLIVDQITSTLTDAGYATVCIAGRELDPEPCFHQDYTVCNSIYTAACQYELAGVVFLAGALGSDITSNTRLQEFADQFAHLPRVSFGMALDNIPSVLIEEKVAAREMYAHLLSRRKCNQPAFVTGKANDLFSLNREQTFCDEARKHGYSSESILRVSGDYSAITTYNKVTALLASHPEVDVIAAANDLMAESAARAVYAAGKRIPEDILITGFDDTKEATRIYPAITTVRQPLAEMSRQCARLMLDTISYRTQSQARAPQERVYVNAELIIRGSTVASSIREPVAQSTSECVRRMTHSLSGLEKPAGINLDALGGALWESANNGSNAIDLCLQQTLELSPPDILSIHWWNNLCYHIESVATQLAQSSTSGNSALVIKAAIAAVRQQLWAIDTNNEFDKQRNSSVKANMQLQMSSCVKQIDILNTMSRWLQQTTIDLCFLIRYSTPGSVPDSRAQLLYVFKNGDIIHPESEFFDTTQVLPESYELRFNKRLLIQTPIHAGYDLFGYLLVDPSGLDNLYLDSAAQSIGNALRNQHLIAQLELQTQHLQNTNRELVKLANYDELTKLPNRLQFNANLKDCCDSALKSGNSLTLLFIDLDGFKLVNDTLGHRAGDELLQEVGQRLQAATRNTLGRLGFIARLGGDEFTVTITEASAHTDIEAISNIILQSLSRPYTISKRTINISASIGMAEYPTDASTVEELIKNADSAMYRAKEKGKNQAAWYTAELSVVSDTLLQMDNDMRLAVLSGDICMHYQPRVNMDTGRVSAVEALMRWTIETPEGRKVRTRPDVFIAVAEKTGFISNLDIFALDEACRQARAWELGGTPLLVAVNVSVLHMQQDNFVENVLNALSRHQLSPRLLELEITESAMMTQVETNVKKLQALRDLGIQLSIDDFGTGYSSLSYLKQLPVNNLKIDKSFIADIDTLRMRRSADAAIIKSVIALGRSMDFQIIAEGIETESQRQFLRALGCHEAQGFLFARPAPASDLTKMLMPVNTIRKSA